jgi:iron complex transport system substrate-binding protein
MLILGLKNKVVAVDNAPYQIKDFYFGNGSAVKNLVNMNAPDYELVETMNLDVLLTFSYAGTEEKQAKLTDVDVIYLGMYRPDVQDPEKSEYFQGILKAGYIFGVVERAEAYMNWLLNIRDKIDDVTSKIPEAEKPKVLMTNYSQSYFQTGVETTTWSVYTSIDPMGQALLLAGGHAVAQDILTPDQYAGGSDRTLYGAKVAPESIAAADIDYAFGHCVKYTYGGTVVAGPDHGYGISDPKEMNDAYKLASSRDLADIDHIYIIAGDFRNGASGCMLLAAYMAKILHPDLFENLDPLEYHQQYITDWMGISGYDIHKDGVFISPAI